MNLRENISIKSIILGLILLPVGSIFAMVIIPNFYIAFIIGVGFSAFFIGWFNYINLEKAIINSIIISFLFSLLSIPDILSLIVLFILFSISGLIGSFIGVQVRRTYRKIWKEDKST